MSKRKRILVLVVLLLLLAAAVAASLLLGVADLTGPDGAINRDVLSLRLSRVWLALVVGAGLSVAGVMLQAVLRNPLAEPYLLGVSAGGGLGAALALALGVTAAGSLMVTGYAFLGAIGTIFLVYALARVGGRVPIHNLLLAGVVVGAMFGSILMFLVSISNTNMLRDIIGWLLGNLEVARWSDHYAVTVAVVLGVGLAMVFRRDLNVMLLGEEPAAHLGLRVERMKKFFFILGSLVTAAAVATCGIIGFVGLIVPHVMRMILGADHRYLVPGAALAGALFLVVTDAFARNILRLTPLGAAVIPIGVVTAILGGPFFLYLLRRRRKGYWG